MRKIRAFLVAISLALTTMLVAPAQAGAQANVCPGSPYGNGWFDSYNPYTNRHAAVNCTITGNYIVLTVQSVYNGTLYTAVGAGQLWIPTSFCNIYSFTNGSPYNPFRINLGAAGGYGCGQGTAVQVTDQGSYYKQLWSSGLGNYARMLRRGTSANQWAGVDEGPLYLDSGGIYDTMPFVAAKFQTLSSVYPKNWSTFWSYLYFWAA